MLRTRIVSLGVIAAVALASMAGAVTAQSEPSGQAGQPLPLLAGLKPPHDTKSHRTSVHAKTAHKAGKTKLAARKRHPTAAAAKLASKETQPVAAAATAEPPAQPPQEPQASPLSAADTTPPADTAVMPPPQTPPPENETAPSAVTVGGQTVQIAAPDEVNPIDVAADDVPDSPAAEHFDSAAAPASPTVAAAPAREQTNAVGSASWMAQVLAALGGALAAGVVAWFLIGSGPVRTYS